MPCLVSSQLLPYGWYGLALRRTIWNEQGGGLDDRLIAKILALFHEHKYRRRCFKSVPMSVHALLCECRVKVLGMEPTTSCISMRYSMSAEVGPIVDVLVPFLLMTHRFLSSRYPYGI